MNLPADTDPFVALAAAAEYVSSGQLGEVELIWWADDDKGQRSLTITLRGADQADKLIEAVGDRLSAELVAPAVPDDLRGLGDAAG